MFFNLAILPAYLRIFCRAKNFKITEHNKKSKTFKLKNLALFRNSFLMIPCFFALREHTSRFSIYKTTSKIDVAEAYSLVMNLESSTFQLTRSNIS